MTTLRNAGLVAACVAVGSAAQAEDVQPGPLERLELRAHERLHRVRMSEGTELAPFSTDGCSGGLSEIWRAVARQFPGFAQAHEDAPPWEQCCVTHDRAYHLGGADPAPRASLAARLAADEALRGCVRDTAADRLDELSARYDMTGEQVAGAYALISQAMFEAVRLGGFPCTGLSWRWGYGWPHCGLAAAAAD